MLELKRSVLQIAQQEISDEAAKWRSYPQSRSKNMDQESARLLALRAFVIDLVWSLFIIFLLSFIIFRQILAYFSNLLQLAQVIENL